MKINSLLLALLFLICIQNNGLAQIGPIYQSKGYPDSSFYWININYLKCLESEHSVCDCLSQNEIVMLFLQKDTTKAIILSSAFHFGLEQSELCELSKNSYDQRFYTINSWRDDSITMKFENEQNALVIYNGRSLFFRKDHFKTLYKPKTLKGVFNQELDLHEQLQVINSRSLLKYSSQSDSVDTIISFEKLKHLIDEKKVYIHCSDDFFYNEMVIKGDTNRFYYLQYDKKRLIIYDEVLGRDRDELINLNKMKRQIFIRKLN